MEAVERTSHSQYYHGRGKRAHRQRRRSVPRVDQTVFNNRQLMLCSQQKSRSLEPTALQILLSSSAVTWILSMLLLTTLAAVSSFISIDIRERDLSWSVVMLCSDLPSIRMCLLSLCDVQCRGWVIVLLELEEIDLGRKAYLCSQQSFLPSYPKQRTPRHDRSKPGAPRPQVCPGYHGVLRGQ